MTATIAIDHASLLVSAPGTAKLAAIESTLADASLTLDVAITDETVASWLARGSPGAPTVFADPADHLVAGLAAKLRNGRTFLIRPAPRRAVGPDLTALVLGAGGRFASIERVWLRVFPKDRLRVTLPTTGLELDPPLSDDEAELLDAVFRELSR